ncbi:DegT/DnrJ/EryC1/StrS family aminotransferase [Phenylobacterium sp. LjRoot225]|uniref:DegT/DnrJ/EryC1/StrS family aminotransferase n=1 Tax=Phenylobacterium sp. LjRoot225 TaxID=3342285 RepID=UPI003ECE57FC
MKFFQLDVQEPELKAELDAAYQRVLANGQLILGPELAAFEAEFAAYCGAGQAIGVGNGLDALVLTLRAAGVGPGDEVIVPSHTFAATWLAVTQVGARPVPVEPDPASYTISAEAVGAALTPRTAAVIPVSLYGHPADMDPILALAADRGLFVLEDAAQSHGAEYRGRRTGGLAHATAFSFYPTKNLGALGDGGAVTTSDAALADRIRKLRNYGSARKYEHELSGVNSRLDELQAAFLRAKLPRLDAANGARRTHAAAYAEALTDIPGVTPPAEAAWARHVYHLYVVRCADRAATQARLAQAEVQTLIHYPTACHQQPAFAELGFRPGQFPLAERLAADVLSLPMWPGMDEGAPERIAAALRSQSGIS